MGKKHKISFGEFHEQIGKEDYELLEEEVDLLKKAYKEVKSEEDIIKDFEKKMQKLAKTLFYLDGYVTRIEEGDQMLKLTSSVKVLGEELSEQIDEVESLSKLLIEKEQETLQLGKHVGKILTKAKKYQNMIFG